jgi:hypothetical protein
MAQQCALSARVTGRSTMKTGMAIDVTIGGPAATASIGAQEQQANCQYDSSPTNRIVSSPEAGPGATVGTLNQGYPLLQHEDAAPMRRPQATRRTVPGPAAWASQRAPRGKKRQHIPVHIMGSGPPQKGTGPLYI